MMKHYKLTRRAGRPCSVKIIEPLLPKPKLPLRLVTPVVPPAVEPQAARAVPVVEEAAEPPTITS